MLLVFSVLGFCLSLPQAQVLIMNQLLCLGPIGVFLVMGLLRLGCERGWPGLVLGVTGTAPLSLVLPQPGFRLFKSCFRFEEAE